MKTCLPNFVNDYGLLVVSALPAELRFLIDYYAAVREEGAGPWPVYCNADRSVVLVETGIGSLSASAAVAHTIAHYSIPSVWSVLNVGIAGSGNFPVGQWVLAQEVVDTTSDLRFYLRPPRIHAIPRGCLRSYPSHLVIIICLLFLIWRQLEF